MKRFLKLGSFIAIAAVFVVSLVGLTGVAARSNDATPMIVGGNNAVEQYGAALLWYPDRPRCAASLINQYWALTSAHCQNVLVIGQTEIRASSKDNSSGYEPNIRLANYYIHPGYNSNTLADDIALIKFDKPVKQTTPLTIATQSPAIGTVGKIASWGWICEDASNPSCGRTVNILQELSVKIVADSKCGYLFDPQNQLCMVASNGTNAMAC